MNKGNPAELTKGENNFNNRFRKATKKIKSKQKDGYLVKQSGQIIFRAKLYKFSNTKITVTGSIIPEYLLEIQTNPEDVGIDPETIRSTLKNDFKAKAGVFFKGRSDIKSLLNQSFVVDEAVEANDSGGNDIVIGIYY